MAQQYGLGNFLYEVEVSGGKANFTFYDPQDASNTVEVSIAQSDFPDGVSADSRQVADMAYDQCQRVLNEKRDARQKKEAADQLASEKKEEARARQDAQDFYANSQDVTVEPAKVEKDGTTVYNTENNGDSSSASDNSQDNKKK